MRLTWRDGVAAVLVAALAVVYGLYLAWGGISLITDANGNTSVGILDPTGMAGIGLIVGAIAAVVGGWVVLGRDTITSWVTGGLGVISALLGVLALAGENLFGATTWEYVLGAFMASVALLFLIAIGRHAGIVGGTAAQGRPGMTAA